MKCPEVEKLIFDGETSKIKIVNDDNLKEHIAACKNCREFADVLQIESLALDKIQKSVIVLDEEKIINSVINKLKKDNSEYIRKYHHKIMDFIFTPSFRLALALLLFGLLGWYFSVEYYDHQKITMLEKRLNIESGMDLNKFDNAQLALAGMGRSINTIINGIINGEIESKDMDSRQYKSLLKLLVESEAKYNDKFRTFLQSLQVNVRNGLDENELETLFKNIEQIKTLVAANGGE
jgi:hypothetical protein